MIMKLVSFIMYVSAGLLTLLLIEGMFTLGSVFNFENYTLIGYVFQALLLSVTLSISVQIWYDEQRKKDLNLKK